MICVALVRLGGAPDTVSVTTGRTFQTCFGVKHARWASISVAESADASRIVQAWLPICAAIVTQFVTHFWCDVVTRSESRGQSKASRQSCRCGRGARPGHVGLGNERRGRRSGDLVRMALRKRAFDAGRRNLVRYAHEAGWLRPAESHAAARCAGVVT